MLSQRIQDLGVSPNRKYLPYTNAASARGIEVIKLNVGQPDIDTPDLYFEAIESFPDKKLGYANSKGIDPMIQAQIEYYEKYGLSYNKDEVLITSGASEAIIFLIISLCNPGDGVILLEPYYVNYSLIIDILGVEIHPIQTSVATNYAVPDAATLDEAVKENSKVLMVSNPGNPTGRVYSKEEMDRIHDFVLRHDLILIADEVYREFNFSGREFTSFAEYDDLQENLVLLDSASKKYAACGARVGSLASKNDEIIAALTKLCQMRLAIPQMEQYAVSKLVNLDDSYFDQVRDLYESRKNVLFQALEAIEDIQFSKPEGAFYTLVKLPVDSAEDFVIWTLENFEVNGKTMLPSPAETFYATPGLGKDEIRISYCIDAEKLKEGINILDKALDAYPHSYRNK